jgi:hypothetical protein
VRRRTALFKNGHEKRRRNQCLTALRLKAMGLAAKSIWQLGCTQINQADGTAFLDGVVPVIVEAPGLSAT